MTAAMSGIEGVLDVHDLHIWSLGSSTHALSSHVLIEDMPPSSSERILKRINDVLVRFRNSSHDNSVRTCAVRCFRQRMPVNAPATHVHAHDH